MTSLAGHILGRYRLIQPIGRGGMATVFQAHDSLNNRNVAVKVLSPAMAQHPQFSRRFRREAGLVMQLKHPHIVPVIDFGETAGYAYLVMPYLPRNLTERLDLGPLKPLEGARLMAQISSALAFAHEKGVVHRDIKPSNILLDREDNALLSDFGLAHINDASMSLTGSALLGTPTYISPEQARGDPVDARTDQYSLGIVLFQLVTGRVPFEADTPLAVLVKHVNEPLPRPSEVNPRVPEVMERVILKATAKEPKDRFPSVMDMNQAFQAALAHAVDPEANPAPRIELPPASDPQVTSAAVPPLATGEEPPLRRRWSRLAWLAALLLLLALACPIASSGVLGILEGAANPVAGSELSTADLEADQLTALAGTIEALSSRPSQTPIVRTVLITSTVVSIATQPTQPWTPTATPTELYPVAAWTNTPYPTAPPTRVWSPPAATATDVWQPPTATRKPKKPAPTSTPKPTQPPPTATPKPPTATSKPPTATPKPPTATPKPPTATPRPPTATLPPPYP